MVTNTIYGQPAMASGSCMYKREHLFKSYDTYQAISIIEQQLKGILNSRIDMAEAVNGILDSRHPRSIAMYSELHNKESIQSIFKYNSA